MPSDQFAGEIHQGDRLFVGVVVTMTLLAAAWGALMASSSYVPAALVGVPVLASWFVLFKERGLDVR